MFSHWLPQSAGIFATELTDERLAYSADCGAGVCLDRQLRMVAVTSTYVAWSIFLGIVLLALWAATSMPGPLLGPT